MSQKTLAVGCWLMALVFPLSAMGSDAVGMLTTTGTVLVDGRSTSLGSALFAGEIVETKARSKAVIVSRGRVVSLGENSSLRMSAKELELQSGAVVVSAADSVLRVDNVTITSSPALPSKFLARKVNGSLQVLALEGTVLVDDGQQTTQVPATRGISIGGARKGFGWLLNDDIGILIVVAAAITAGVTLGLVNASNAKPVSPSLP